MTISLFIWVLHEFMLSLVMHIVLVHFERVPVKLYGGSERVIECLARGLLEQGHKVSLIALKGDYPIKGVQFLDLDRFGAQAKSLQSALTLIPDDTDIVHFHLPIGEQECQNLEIPYVCTLHGNEKHPETLPANTVFLTQNHAQRHGRTHYVFNGLDGESAPLNKTPVAQREYFSFLGRASLKRKGLHLAKPLAKQLGAPLYVGGGRGLGLFNTKYLGHLNDEQKYKLLGGSRALLFPILWEEPFGLVLIESMFTGTPVFALNRGSVVEVLGQKGSEGMFVYADSIEQLTEKALDFRYDFSPEQYRRYALEHFSYQKMAHAYIQIYSQILLGYSLFSS